LYSTVQYSTRQYGVNTRRTGAKAIQHVQRITTMIPQKILQSYQAPGWFLQPYCKVSKIVCWVKHAGTHHTPVRIIHRLGYVENMFPRGVAGNIELWYTPRVHNFVSLRSHLQDLCAISMPILIPLCTMDAQKTANRFVIHEPNVTYELQFICGRYYSSCNPYKLPPTLPRSSKSTIASIGLIAWNVLYISEISLISSLIWCFLILHLVTICR